jgi:glycosyltransferase involved in cell wall biosynthesis
MAAGTLTAILHEEGHGACAARNAAIVAANGEFITGLDDDDYFLSDRRIEWFIELWEAAGPGTAGIFDSVNFNTGAGIITAHQTAYANHTQLRRQNLVGNQVFAPRKHYIDAGLFDSGMPAWQDWDLWIRMSERFGTFINLNRLTSMVDASHDSERITQRDERVLREAMHRLSGKLANLSLAERAWLIVTLHAYPQVRPEMAEIGTLMLAFRFRLMFRAIRKRLA